MQDYEGEELRRRVVKAAKPLRKAFKNSKQDVKKFNAVLEEYIRKRPSATSVRAFAVEIAALLQPLAKAAWKINSIVRASGYAGFVGVVLDDPFADTPRVNFIVITTASCGEICPISTEARSYPFDILDSLSLRDMLQTEDTAENTAGALLSLIPEDAEGRSIENLIAGYAASIMELLQIEINLNNDREGCTECLRQLARKLNRLPPSFYVQDVVREGKNPVGGGTYADVYKGSLHGKPVCLKVLRYFTLTSNQNKLLRDFRREVIVWKHLKHDNILPFLGGNLDLFAPSFCMISPWLANGNLARFLESHPSHDRLAAVKEIAKAIRYLHDYSPPIVHGDIRCANILVTDDGHCLLADFGLATVVSLTPIQTQPTSPKGATRWMAPELLGPNDCPETPAPERDIYAFACTVVEIYTGKLPFHEINNDTVVSLEVMQGRRPERPTTLPTGEPSSDHIWRMIQECWKQDPKHRLKAGEVVTRLDSPVASGGRELGDNLQSNEDHRNTTALPTNGVSHDGVERGSVSSPSSEPSMHRHNTTSPPSSGSHDRVTQDHSSSRTSNSGGRHRSTTTDTSGRRDSRSDIVHGALGFKKAHTRRRTVQ